MNASLRPDRSATLGVVSAALPEVGFRSLSGYQIILDELFGSIPPESIVYVGLGRSREASVRLPWFRTPRRRPEALLAAAATVAGSRLSGRILHARYPNVRRIVALVDPALPLAVDWAEASGAELWLYAIDLHAGSFWHAPPLFDSFLERSCRRAWSGAARAFALSPGIAEWFRTQGVRCPIEVLPPLISVQPEPSPLPSDGERPSLLYTGSIYSANQAPLRWLERAATSLGNADLRLVSSLDRSYLRTQLDLERWTVSAASGEGVLAAVRASTWTVIALDPTPDTDWRLPLCWPTKLREYLSVGRPVFCIAGHNFDIAKMATARGWGRIAASEAETMTELRAALSESRESLARRGAAAHAFAITEMNNRTIGERWRKQALA